MKKQKKTALFWTVLMTHGRLELPTLCLEGRCSNPAELKRQVIFIIHQVTIYFNSKYLSFKNIM